MSALSGGIFEHGVLVVDGGGIAFAGSAADVDLQRFDEVIDLEGRVVTPGLVDAHTHLVYGGNRANEFEMRARGLSYEQIAREGGGILSTMRATRDSYIHDLSDLAARRMGWMIRNGTTTAEVKSGYGLACESELRMLDAATIAGKRTGMRTVLTLLAAHGVPPEFADSGDRYIAYICNQIVPAAAKKGARYVDAFVESIAFSKSQAKQVIECGNAHGMGARLHVDQLAEGGGAAFAASVGAVTADHLEYTSADGIAAMAAAGVQPVLLPGSVLMLGRNKYPDARAMLDAGLAVVLATDHNPGSSPVCSLPLVMTLGVTMMRMTPIEALAAVTINAAKSLDLGKAVGSLEPGKAADFVVWNARDYREICYWAGAPLVHETWIAGSKVL